MIYVLPRRENPSSSGFNDGDTLQNSMRDHLKSISDMEKLPAKRETEKTPMHAYSCQVRPGDVNHILISLILKKLLIVYTVHRSRFPMFSLGAHNILAIVRVHSRQTSRVSEGIN